MFTFASSSLTSLHLLTRPRADVRAYLLELHHNFSGLESLYLHLTEDQDDFWPVMGDSLISLSPTLQSLELGGRCCIPVEMLDYIAQMPHLRVLKLKPQGLKLRDRRFALSGGPRRPINALEVLDLEDGVAAYGVGWEAIFGSYCFPSLRSLHITASPSRLGTAVPGLMIASVLPAAVSPLTLRELDISESLARTDGQALHADRIFPLRAFTNLTRLVITSLNGIAWDDETLSNFIAAFPYLRAFHVLLESAALSSNVSRTSTTRPTLKGLASVIKLCPDLRELSLAVDTKVVPLIDEEPCHPFNHQLRTINVVSGSPGEDLDALAHFLHTLLPNLKCIRCLGHSAQARSVWREVEERLEKLAGVGDSEELSKRLEKCIVYNKYGSPLF